MLNFMKIYVRRPSVQRAMPVAHMPFNCEISLNPAQVLWGGDGTLVRAKIGQSGLPQTFPGHSEKLPGTTSENRGGAQVGEGDAEERRRGVVQGVDVGGGGVGAGHHCLLCEGGGGPSRLRNHHLVRQASQPQQLSPESEDSGGGGAASPSPKGREGREAAIA